MESKNLLKQRLDFPLEKRIETTDRLSTRKCQKIVETTVRFSIWEIQTGKRLPTGKSQRIVETKVRFSILERS